MAKKKMTLEEKLEDAIIKDKPYEVPEKWLWTKLQYVANWTSGGTPKSTHPEYYDGDIPWLIIADMNDGEIYSSNKTITEEGLINSSAKIIDEESVLIAMYGSIGKLGITKIKCSCNQAIAFTKEIMPITYNKFIYYYLMFYRDKIISRGKGGTQQNISLTVLKDVEIVIPPLKEQQRIVDKIESLFEKLDKAKELIEEVRDDFEKRKSAILEKAFRGELTKAWRSNNLVDYNSTWTKHVFSNIAKVKSNLVQPQDFLKYPHIAPDNIEKKTGKLLAYRTIEEDNVKSAKHRFYPGQIIYSKIRPYLSKVVIVDFEGLCSADMYPIETDLDTKYLYYYMLSDTFIDFASNSGSRSVLPKINQKELGKINVPVCSINEQKEIVRILDKLLEEEAKIDELTALEEQIELIKKSILAKAFRGQLGTNSEDDESAIELLKEILNK